MLINGWRRGTTIELVEAKQRERINQSKSSRQDILCPKNDKLHGEAETDNNGTIDIIIKSKLDNGYPRRMGDRCELDNFLCGGDCPSCVRARPMRISYVLLD